MPGLEDFDSVNGYGIIEIKDWSELLDAVAILRTTPFWSTKEDAVCVGKSDSVALSYFRDCILYGLL